MIKFIQWIDSILENLFFDPHAQKPTELPMNIEPLDESGHLSMDIHPHPLPDIVKSPETHAAPEFLLWNNKVNARHSVRVICDQEGFNVVDKDDISKTVHCESDYNPNCIHPNIVNGKVVSTDYGLCQINDYWHIGPGKDFPDKEYVLNNPEACFRWMCKMWKAGKGGLWVCKLKGLNEHYSA